MVFYFSINGFLIDFMFCAIDQTTVPIVFAAKYAFLIKTFNFPGIGYAFKAKINIKSNEIIFNFMANASGPWLSFR